MEQHFDMQAFLAELKAENPLNDYEAAADGVVITAHKATHSITLTCTDRQFNELVEIIDNLGCFYVVDE